jgi:putative acetyltransferase
MRPFADGAMNNFTIRAERPGDEEAIARVHRRAFESDVEARLVSALRGACCVPVSLVAELKFQADATADQHFGIVGHVLFSELRIVRAESAQRSLALAPVAVLPAHQRQGIGSALVREGISTCRAAGYPAVFVLGHREYYPRFGFSPELARQFECVYAGEHFMALELQPGSLDGAHGRIEYPQPFSEL